MKNNQICLNIAKRNAKYVNIIDEYSKEWDTSRATTIFRIVREYHQLRELKVL